MRILMTTDTVGGVWTYATELISGLLQKGAAVALVTVGRAPAAAQTRWLESNRSRWDGSFRWEMSVARLEWMSNNQRAFLDLAPQVVRLAEDFEADLLHSNQFCFGALPVSVPRLVVAHSDVLSWAVACRGKPLEPSPWLESYRALTAAGLRRASAVVAPTRWMLGELAANFELPRNTYVIPNGRTLPDPALRSTRKLQAVTAGRLWDEANNLQLLAGVSATVPIFIAGEAKYESQELPAMPASVTMLGALEPAELLTLFRESTIYVCTSQYEPFGLTPVEAALCGCAVLVNDIPSLREVWGDAAIYFRDADSLSDRLLQLSRDPRRLVAAQHRSWQRAQRYTAAVMVDQYLTLYRTMLSRWESSSDVA
jgi:glycogen(starch) synthase